MFIAINKKTLLNAEKITSIELTDYGYVVVTVEGGKEWHVGSGEPELTYEALACALNMSDTNLVSLERLKEEVKSLKE